MAGIAGEVFSRRRRTKSAAVLFWGVAVRLDGWPVGFPQQIHIWRGPGSKCEGRQVTAAAQTAQRDLIISQRPSWPSEPHDRATFNAGFFDFRRSHSAPIPVGPQRLSLDIEVKHGDVVAAKVRDEELIEVWTAKRTIGGLAEEQILHVLAEKFNMTAD
jgi:hypothetical protein